MGAGGIRSLRSKFSRLSLLFLLAEIFKHSEQDLESILSPSFLCITLFIFYQRVSVVSLPNLYKSFFKTP